MCVCVCVCVCVCLCVCVMLPCTSMWGVYPETSIHHYNIPLSHSFTHLCTIFFIFHAFILHSIPPTTTRSQYTPVSWPAWFHKRVHIVLSRGVALDVTTVCFIRARTAVVHFVLSRGVALDLATVCLRARGCSSVCSEYTLPCWWWERRDLKGLAFSCFTRWTVFYVLWF